jgi:PST family polysaccharide transporter
MEFLGLITMRYKKEFSKAIIYTGIFNIIISFILIFYFKDIGSSFSFVFSEIFLLIYLFTVFYKIEKS